METIEIVEDCVGVDVIIDGESIQVNENDERSEEYLRYLKLKLVSELSKVIDNVSTYDLKTIAEIITINGDEWVYDDEISKSNKCDQCGNYNFREVFNKKIQPI